MIILKNPNTGAPIIDFVVDKTSYKFAVGELGAFQDNVGENLLKTYGFLERVELQADSGGKFKCPQCEYVNERRIGVLGHMRGHNNPDLKPGQVLKDQTGPDVKEVVGIPVVSLEDKLKARDQEAYADLGVAPAGVIDKDGVEWTGAGLEKDSA